MGWLADWGKRVKIPLDHDDIDATLSNFPHLIYISESSGYNNKDITFVFDELTQDANRKKIAITQSNGTTQCYVEIEKWDHGNEKAWLCVKVPSVSSSADTDLYLYYDSSQSDNTTYVGDPNSTPAENVWDANYSLVTHLQDDPDASHVRDSTSNNRDGTKTGSNEPIETTDGQIGDAQDFAGDDDLISHGIFNPAGDSNKQLTAAVWFKGPEGDYAISKWEPNALNFFLGIAAGGFYVVISDQPTWDAAHVKYYVNTVDYRGTTRRRFSFTWDGNLADTSAATRRLKLFVNGARIDDAILTKTFDGDITTVYNSATPFLLGHGDDPGVYIDGILDEARISSIARTIAWEKACYESERDHLNDFGVEDTGYQKKLFREFLAIFKLGDFPYDFPITWEEGLSKDINQTRDTTLDITDYFSTLRSIVETVSQSIDIIDYLQWSGTKYLTEFATVSDVILQTYDKGVIDTLTLFSDVYLKGLKSLIDQVTLNPYLDTVWNAYKLYTTTLDTQDFLQAITQRFLEIFQSSDIEDYLTYVSNTYRRVSDTMIVSHYLYYVSQWKYVISQAIDITDYLSWSISKIMSIYQSLDIYGALTSLITTWVRSYTTQLDITHYYSRISTWEYVIPPDTLNITDYLDTIFGWVRSILQPIDIYSNFESFAMDLARRYTDQLDITGYFTRIWNAQEFIYQSINIQDSLSSKYGQFLELLQTLDIWDSVVHIWNTHYTLSQSLGVQDYFSRESIWYHTLIQLIDIQDYIITAIQQFLIVALEPLTVSDYRYDVWSATYHITQTMTLWSIIIGYYMRLTIPKIETVLVFDWTSPSSLIPYALLDQININQYLSSIWNAYIDWPITADGIIVHDFYATAQDMLRPMANDIFLIFDSNYWESIWKRRVSDTLTLLDYYLRYPSIAITQALTLLDSLSTITEFYRLYSQYLSLSSLYTDTWTALREMSESLDIVQVSYSTLWSIIHRLTINIQLSGYLTTARQWIRNPDETLNIGAYLYQVYRHIIDVSLNIESYWISTRSFYRVLQETTDIAVFMTYISQFLRRTIETLDISDLYEYLSHWSRLPYEDITLYHTVIWIAQFYRTYIEETILSAILRRIAGSWLYISQSLDIASYLTYTSWWYPRLTDGVLMISDIDRIVTWSRRSIDNLLLMEYLSKFVHMEITPEPLSILSYVSTIANYPRDILQSLSLIDYLSVRSIVNYLLMLQYLDLSDYLSRNVEFYRTIDEMIGALSYLGYVITHLGANLTILEIQSITLSDIAPFLRLDRVTNLLQALSMLDVRLMNTQKIVLDQMSTDDYVLIGYSKIMDIAIQITDHLFTSWTLYRVLTDDMDITSRILGPVATVWETVDMYLKRITATVISKMDEIQR